MDGACPICGWHSGITRNSNGRYPVDYELPTPLVDWIEAYGVGDDPARWLAEPLLPDGGAVAIFAKGGTGKSLLALWLAAGLATGTGLVGPTEPIHVLYLDYEMTIRDVVERLEDMAYDDPVALERLHYASLPTLPPLDTEAGGRAVVEMALHVGATLVVVDTFGRAVDGEEDSADTVRAWYRWTGQLLKASGIAFLRIDHAGKDIKRGQRGTSAKNDDVDVVWEMVADGNHDYILRATKRRVSWVAESVRLTQTDDNGVLAYAWDGAHVTYLAGTRTCSDLLDALGAPVDISRRKAMVLLREHGHGTNNNVVADAIRYRHASVPPPVPLKSGPPEGPDTTDTESATAQVVPPGYHRVPLGDPTGHGREGTEGTSRAQGAAEAYDLTLEEPW